MQNHTTSGHCIFEYMYRDAGNWKTHGALLLAGEIGGARDSLREYFESEDLFVAEQVGIPSLCFEHFATCGDGPSDLDHAYHEFVDLLPATCQEAAAMPVADSLENLPHACVPLQAIGMYRCLPIVGCSKCNRYP
jgi:hypothetical protein